MVFTIFTVMCDTHLSRTNEKLTRARFLPLSFFTSLFGINAREWSGDQDNLTLSTMFEIAGKYLTSSSAKHLLTNRSTRLLCHHRRRASNGLQRKAARRSHDHAQAQLGSTEGIYSDSHPIHAALGLC